MSNGKKATYLQTTAIVILIAAHLVSCKQGSKPIAEKKATPDTSQQAIKPQAQQSSNQDSIPEYTEAVYDAYISPAIKALLQENLPEWRLPLPDRWEKFWFHAYKKDSSLVDYAKGEFNGDGKPDYALLMENEQGAFMVWVLQSGPKDYEAIELTEITEATLPLNTGLDLIDKGKLNHLNMDNGVDGTKTLNLKHQAIQVAYFEASAETYYWKGNKFVSVTTGD